MEVKVDDNFIGKFLTKAECLDETGISKSSFIQSFRNI